MGGDVATTYPDTMTIVICIVNGTRSQKPAPNQSAACAGEAPIAMLATLVAFGTWFAVVWNVVQAPPPVPVYGAFNTTAPAQQYQQPQQHY